jgi:hypothetical protein
MSSFAEGFAKAFVPSFTRSIEANNEAFDNKVARGLELFQNSEERLREARAENEERLRIAEETVTELGLPADAVGNVYAWLGQGRKIEDIRADAISGTFRSIPAPVGAPSASPVDSEMTNLGMSDDFEGFWGRVIQAESGGDPTAVSPVGAMGVAQIMPATAMAPGFGLPNIFQTARELGVEVGQETPEEARRLLQNAEVNDTFGRGYMSSMLERYSGDREKALIAYNFSFRAADNYNGSRATLPEETRNYLNRVLGPRPEGQIQTGATNTAETSPTTNTDPTATGNNQEPEGNWLQRARARADRRITDEIISTLNVSEEYYNQVVSGYTPAQDRPAIRMAFSPAKDPEDTPNWQDLTNITSSNYRQFAAEARANDDEDQAVAIESLGQAISEPDNPTYAEFATMTASNAEGRLIAATAAGDTETATIIQDFINRNEPTPAYSDFSTITVQNARGRAIAAENAGDQEALDQIIEFIEENDNSFPDRISADYVRARFFESATRAQSGSDDDVAAFETFQNTELPLLMASLRLTETNTGPSSLTQAYQNLQRLKRSENPDPVAIEQAEQDYADLLAVESARSNARNAGDLVRFVRPSEGGGFQSVQGSVDASGNMVDDTGQPLEGEGWRRLGEAEERELNSIATTLRTDIRNYNTAQEATLSSLRLGGQIVELVSQNPRALTSTAGVLKQIVSLGREANTLTSIVEDIVGQRRGENDYTDLNQIQAELRSRGALGEGETLQSLADTPIQEVLSLGSSAEGLARARSILESKILLMGFRAGALEGQSGQALSNRDFDRLMIIIRTSTDGPTFQRGMSEYLQDRVDGLGDRYRNLSPENVAELRLFQNLYGYNPLEGTGLVVSPESIRNNPPDARVAVGLSIIDGTYQPNTRASQTTVPVSEAIDMLRANPNLRNFFIQTYGEDALPEDMRGGQ